MSYETLLYEVSERVATITFNRPEKMNTWNAQVASELSEAMLKAVSYTHLTLPTNREV